MKFRIYFEVLEQSFLFSNLIKKLYKDAEVELVNTKISTTKKFTIAKNLYPSMCLKDFDGIVSYFDSKFICINIGKKDIIIEKLNQLFRVVLNGKNRTMIDCKC